ncbi:hypothetical protein AB0E69_36640 [Kribbella sp. NPDC026611]|uniref:hypothetical protein n=1 Tax=Kribbella sp. NPDC026611 TaxID=3154911 RepID=UPI0033BFDF4B
MDDFDAQWADAVVRVPLGARFTYDQIRDTVQEVCGAAGVEFYEEPVETPGYSGSYWGIGQHAGTPEQNLGVYPGHGIGRRGFSRTEVNVDLLVVGHEKLQDGRIHGTAQPHQRSAEATSLAWRLTEAFNQRTDGEHLLGRGAALFQQDQLAAGGTRSTTTDGAQDRHPTASVRVNRPLEK